MEAVRANAIYVIVQPRGLGDSLVSSDIALTPTASLSIITTSLHIDTYPLTKYLTICCWAQSSGRATMSSISSIDSLRQKCGTAQTVILHPRNLFHEIYLFVRLIGSVYVV